MKKSTWSKILNNQIIVYLILGLINLYLLNVTVQNAAVSAMTIFFVLASIAILLSIELLKFLGLRKLKHIISILFLPFIFLIITNGILYRIQVLEPSIATLLVIIDLLLSVLVLIPIVFVEYGTIDQNIFRLGAVIVLMASLLFSSVGFITKNIFLNEIVLSGIIIPIIFLPCVYLIVKQWGYQFNLNLKIQKNFNFQWLALLFLLLFMVWFPFFKIYLSIGDSWSTIIWRWNFNYLNPFNSIVYKSALLVFLSALEAALFEEVARYLFLLLTLSTLEKKKLRLLFAILISDILFALFHYSNLFDNQRTIQSVNQQVIATLGFGIFSAVLYLYTGQIWLPILMHFLMDFLSFSLTPLGGAAGLIASSTNGELLVIVLNVMVPLLAALPFFFGKRRQVMEQNANRITKYILSH